MNAGLQFDWTYLDEMSGGDARMRAMLLEMLSGELSREIVDLRMAVRTGKADQVFQVAHSLKSTLAYTGHAETLALNARLESATRAGHWGLNEHMAAAELLEVLERMARVLAGPGV